jgi:uncharacterized protein YneF (UPF0154 family)
MAGDGEQKVGFRSMLVNVKGWFSGMGKGWKIPAAVGVVAAVAISGPIGLGIAGGMWASSRVRGDEITDKAKNAALMGVGAGTCATSTAIGATIGSFIFPLIGTLIGAGFGMLGGMVAARKVTQKVKENYKMDKNAPTSSGHTPIKETSPPKKKTRKERNKESLISTSRSMGVKPDSEHGLLKKGKHTRREANRRALKKISKHMEGK